MLIPARRTVELIVRHAIRRAEDVRISALTKDLQSEHHEALEALISPSQVGEVTMLSWLKAAPKSASAKSAVVKSCSGAPESGSRPQTFQSRFASVVLQPQACDKKMAQEGLAVMARRNYLRQHGAQGWPRH